MILLSCKKKFIALLFQQGYIYIPLDMFKITDDIDYHNCTATIIGNDEVSQNKNLNNGIICNLERKSFKAVVSST